MVAHLVIALAAGSASGVMFASIVSGSLISLSLLYLSPLPLMVAALGWSPLWAAIGSGAAAVGLAAVFGSSDGIAFAVAVALPACWLGHLSLLGRPVTHANRMTQDADAPLEWYPVGRILPWIAGFAALATGAALLTLGTDAATINDTLRGFLQRSFALSKAGTSPEIEHWIDTMVHLAPSAAAIVTTATLTFNLWLAAKVTATSGRLQRPWPDLRAAALPAMTLAALCVAIAFCFSGGLLGMLANIVASALLMAYVLTGFAVLHTLTLALKSRAFWLGSAYAAVMVLGWPMLAMAALGLADALFGLRQRYLQSHSPPLATP
ncbi:MAG: hypothetical protein ACREDL_15955 [Bradyrhizobium sp.]